jgi:hypothetical protein
LRQRFSAQFGRKQSLVNFGDTGQEVFTEKGTGTFILAALGSPPSQAAIKGKKGLFNEEISCGLFVDNGPCFPNLASKPQPCFLPGIYPGRPTQKSRSRSKIGNSTT